MQGSKLLQMLLQIFEPIVPRQAKKLWNHRATLSMTAIFVVAPICMTAKTATTIATGGGGGGGGAAAAAAAAAAAGGGGGGIVGDGDAENLCSHLCVDQRVVAVMVPLGAPSVPRRLGKGEAGKFHVAVWLTKRILCTMCSVCSGCVG